MTLSRRRFVREGISLAAAAALPASAKAATGVRADHALRIKPCTLEIGKGVGVRTVGYNGQVPGPVLRLREGRPVTIDVHNETSVPELVHWHGLRTDALNDGAMEEGSPMVPAGGKLRYSFTPEPAGTRWYHTHAMAKDDLARAAYTGQFGFLLVEGRDPSPAVDREFLLAIHHWEPHFVPMAAMMQAESANMPATAGSDVGYRYATINQHMLGFGEPLRVKRGERVLMRLLNASATDNVVLALPGHSFEVIAMDGNPVPRRAKVETLSLAVAERVDAIVEMNSPGVWVLGSTLAASRAMGLGVVVEYAGSSGAPVWKEPVATKWDYGLFAMPDAPKAAPDAILPVTFMDVGPDAGSRFDRWTVNGKSWPDGPDIFVQQGKRYRLQFRNASADQHPMHLHRHSFEVVQIGRCKMSGLIKDTVNVMPLETVLVDFVADNPGDSLLHCHMQLHMDYGFLQRIRYRA